MKILRIGMSPASPIRPYSGSFREGPTNAAASALGVGAFGVSAKALSTGRLLPGHPIDAVRHWMLVTGDSGGASVGAACAVPAPRANMAPAPAIAIPVAYG